MKLKFRIVLVCIIIGGVAFFYGFFDCVKLLIKGPVDYVDIAVKEYKNGTMVYGEIKYIFDVPIKEIDAGKGENSNVKAYFYLVPIKQGEEGRANENKSFVLVESRNKDDQKILDKIMEETYDDSLEDAITSFKITGKVTKLDKETEKLLADWFITNEFFSESERDLISDYIVSNIITIQNWNIIYITTGVGFVLMAFGIAGLIFVFKRRG